MLSVALHSVREVVIQPDRFFDERLADHTMLSAIAVVVLAGIAQTSDKLFRFSSLFSIETEADVLPEWGMDVFLSAVATRWLFAIILSLYAWVLLGGLMHTIAQSQSGNGSFLDSLKGTAWGFVPGIFSGLLAIVIMAVILSKPLDDATIAEFVANVASDRLHDARIVSTIGFSLWSGVIWTYAMRRIHGLTIWETFTAVIPAVLVLLFVDVLPVL
jgi:hypothetical protein